MTISEPSGRSHQPTLGAPGGRPSPKTYITTGKVVVVSDVQDVTDPSGEIKALRERLDSCRGVLLSSSYEYPGRYSTWSLGFADPPVVLESWGRRFAIKALNARGVPFLSALSPVVSACPAVAECSHDGGCISGSVSVPEGYFSEEERSKQPSIFSLVRAIVDMFRSDEDPHMGLYGAFGYDLAFQFEDVKLHQERAPEQRDIVLYVPDELLVVNHQTRQSWRMTYDFIFGEAGGVCSTRGLAGGGESVPFKPSTGTVNGRDCAPGEFAKWVDVAKEKFARGDLFEAVLSQTFREPCQFNPSQIFRCLQLRNPSPYGFLINLGRDEWLVGASPEMFVRAENTWNGIRIETCPISGTIRRGKDALEDAENIRRILTDSKEEAEITMCTDVDRNDKSRVCVHGTVQVVGRRQIEMYSRLIHTVDHVEGYLRPEFDAIDAFLVHTWAVTVCGAPKTWAMQFVEETEKSQRRWYGAAVGHIAFDGHLNTGLTLRTVRISGGVAEVRAGATLLFDSVPESEEAETELKASACLAAVRNPVLGIEKSSSTDSVIRAANLVLLIDFEDSFVHTLANYLRQTGATVTTVRHTRVDEALSKMPNIDLVVLSPGPGRPTDFNLSEQIRKLLDRNLSIFGVCLGLQGLVEYFGGSLGQLAYPAHGKPGKVEVESSGIFKGCPESFTVARYHSLYGKRPLPECLVETAHLEENGETIVMGIQHQTLPIAAVQFHPESILTSPQLGLQILENAFKLQQS